MLPAVTDPAQAIKDALTARAKRKEEPTNQTQLATYAGMSWRQWTQRMSGRVPWRLDEVERIARVLDIPMCDLIREEAEK